MLQMVGELREIIAGLGDDRRVVGVEVGNLACVHRIALHGHGQGVALVVQQTDLARVRLRLPEDVPGHLHAADVLADLVVAPADAVHPDDVGHRVARAAVVEGVLQCGPDVLGQVRQVAVVERLHQLLRDEADHLVGAQADHDIEVDGPGRELCGGLVGGVVGRDLDRAVVLLLEALDEAGPDVVGVVVDVERAALGLEAVLDGRVVVGDRPGDAVVGARQRQPLGPVGFGTTNFCTAGLPPPEPDPTAVVVLAQPAATPATPSAAPAPTAPRTRLRRVSRCS